MNERFKYADQCPGINAIVSIFSAGNIVSASLGGLSLVSLFMADRRLHRQHRLK